ncbi:4-hydroxy-tetrahydrodipicolinate reductase [Chloroflexota bacterium]
MGPVAVLVHGAMGRMGQRVLAAVCEDPELKAVAAVDAKATQNELLLPDGSKSIPLARDLSSVPENRHPDVLVDFSLATATMPMARIAARRGISLVIGTTGLSSNNLAEIESLCQQNGIAAVVAPNFSLGAVVMMQLARTAARFFDWAEIIELHHERKVDAPSGTSISTAKGMLETRGKPFCHASPEKETLPGGRGAEYQGIALHSVRLPGLEARQEVVFGAQGQTLSIRHDATSRECYMPGVILAIKKVRVMKGLVLGLDRLLGFQGEA